MSARFIPWHARDGIRLKASKEGVAFARARGTTLKKIAAAAGHPTARIEHYGTRLGSWRVGADVLRYIDFTSRQLTLPFDQPAEQAGAGASS